MGLSRWRTWAVGLALVAAAACTEEPGAEADTAPGPTDVADAAAADATPDVDDLCICTDAGPELPPPDALDCPSDCTAVLGGPQPCSDAVCEGGQCVAKARPDGSDCSTAGSCEVRACQAGQCVVASTTCDDKNPCTTDTCTPSQDGGGKPGGCQHAPVASPGPCDDGDACTVGDICCPQGSAACTPGTCKPGKNQCECGGTDPGECEAKKGDGNLCNGVLTCDTSKAPFKCVLVAGSEKTCPAEDLGECAVSACDPKTGGCIAKPVKEGQACDKTNACAQSECLGGTCTVTTKKCECVEHADCAGKDDPDLCDGTLYCDKSVPGAWKCKNNPAAAVYCSDAEDSACRKNVCHPATGQCQLTATEALDCKDGKCKPLPAGTPAKTPPLCDDGNACTASDQCQGGQCKSGTVICACQSDADCKGQEDGDLCNGTLYCDAATKTCKVNPATIVYCADPGVPCRKTVCQTVGMPAAATCTVVTKDEGLACNDADFCTEGDHCEKGVCKPTANTCTCGKDADCAAHEDGNLCNGTLICDKTKKPSICVVNPATIVQCSTADDTACATAQCVPTTGQCQPKAKPDGTGCNADGNACTPTDTCQSGACKPDTNVCACGKASDCAKFENGDACDGTLYCDTNGAAPACKVNPATVVECAPSQSPCLAHACDKASGKCQSVPTKELLPCDADGNACTLTDVCSKGQCVPGANVCACLSDTDCTAKGEDSLCTGKLYCDKTSHVCKINPATIKACPASDDPCKVSLCDEKDGQCKAANLPDGSPCDDGQECTFGEACLGGKCEPSLKQCACQANSDCLDDGDACNGTPVCDKTASPPKCVIGPAKTCSGGGSGCLVPTCDPKTGECVQGPGSCDDGNPCTLDSCGVLSQKCSHQALGDGTACGGGQVCVGGQCAVQPDGSVLVGGSGWIGCNAAVDPECEADEQPQHNVTISPVFVDRYEVTADAWAQCVTAGKCQAPKGTGPACNFGKPFKGQDPLNCVTWQEAQAFCQWRGGRLPTEAEWELAARGPCKTPDCKQATPRYVWGNLPLPSCAQAWMLGSLGPGCNQGTTLAVGARPADKGALGLFDQAGNVREWTLDAYAAGFYALPAATLPNPQAKDGATRTLRGGGGDTGGVDLRTSARTGQDPGQASPWIGLRCAVPAAKP